MKSAALGSWRSAASRARSSPSESKRAETSGDAIAARALRDENPWIRLAGLSVLGKRRSGAALVRDALKTEGVPFLVDAYRESLERTR